MSSTSTVAPRSLRDSILPAVVGLLVVVGVIYILASQPKGSYDATILSLVSAAGLFAVVSSTAVYKITDDIASFIPGVGPNALLSSTGSPTTVGLIVHSTVYAALTGAMMGIAFSKSS